MAEYVDKEKLYRYLDNEVEWKNNQDRLFALEVVQDEESADVAPIVHAKWIDLYMTETDNCGEVIREEKDTYFMCSNCECIYSKRQSCQRNFCARCGAKLDLEE